MATPYMRPTVAAVITPFGKRLQAAFEDHLPIPLPDSMEHYSGQFKLRIPKSLHRLLSEHSQQEGISMNQYCVYLLSRNDALHFKSK